MNTFGRLFRVSIYGESHGESVGILIDGCPAGIVLSEADFQSDLDRRKPGAKGTTPRKESDLPKLMSGVFNGYTTGAPINIMFENNNVISKDYTNLVDTPRPGHADYVAHKKFKGFNDYRGGGHFSGRLTLGLVAAGVVAKKILKNISIKAALIEAGGSTDINTEIDKALQEGDSIGGIIECRANGATLGLGEPFLIQ
jgi:chorismate synthase